MARRTKDLIKRKKNLGVNIRIFEEMPSGIQNFTSGLFTEFLKTQSDFRCIFFTLGDKRIEDSVQNVKPHSQLLNLIKKIDPRLENIFFDNIYISKLIAHYNIDIFFTPSYILPIYKPKGMKFVTMVHDLYFFKYKHNPLYIYMNYVMYMKIMLPLTLRQADKIVVHSYYVKNQLMDIYKIPDNKITVIYDGKDEYFYQIRNKEDFRTLQKKYALSKTYIFTTATNQERKNIHGLVEAFSSIHRGKDYSLVISGLLPKENIRELNTFIHGLGLSHQVKFLGYVPKEDLRILYSFAKLFIYPSFEEGFGLPILEAVSCNCLPLSSNAGSLPEVVGTQKLLFSPQSVAEISAKITEFLYAPHTKYAYYLKKAQKHTEQFTWKKAVKEYIHLFNSV